MGSPCWSRACCDKTPSRGTCSCSAAARPTSSRSSIGMAPVSTERTSLSQAQAEIERLRLIVQKLQRGQFGRRAERLDDEQLQLSFEDLNADIARVEATLPSEKVKTPASRSRNDRPSLPAHLPREDMRIDFDPQTCPCCGGELHADHHRV